MPIKLRRKYFFVKSNPETYDVIKNVVKIGQWGNYHIRQHTIDFCYTKKEAEERVKELVRGDEK